jgi:phytoene synthase
MSASIFGQADTATLEYAGHLGQCLQLINIIRDVGEDARRGRIYLPLDDLKKHGVKTTDILESRYVDGFVPLMQSMATRARQAHTLAMKALPPSQIRAQRAGLIMAAIYLALLDELERDHFQVLHQRISLTPLRKLFIAWRTWVFGPRRSSPA